MKTQITQEEYRAIDAMSNSELQIIGRSVSDYVWNKNAPTDDTKTVALDFGTALHKAVLEPQEFNKTVLVYTDTLSRNSKAFDKFYAEHKDSGKLILLEAEHNTIRFQVDSSLAHPAFNDILSRATDKECSIFTELDGVKVKIRPDLMICNALYDVKTTASIEDWRSDTRWKNPLFTHGYGHTAAFYMDAMSAFCGEHIDTYTFLVVQKTINLGKYPVAVIEITREECDRYGFFDEVYNNLDKYNEALTTNNWIENEKFPLFYVADDMSIEISEEV